MLSQTFSYWDKKQSADNNIIQFPLTLKCTKDQSSHIFDCFLVSKRISHVSTPRTRPDQISRRIRATTGVCLPWLWSRKSRDPTPTPGNFDYPTPTFSCISYLLKVIILFRWIHKPYLHFPGIWKLVLNRCKCTFISHFCKIRLSRS